MMSKQVFNYFLLCDAVQSADLAVKSLSARLPLLKKIPCERATSTAIYMCTVYIGYICLYTCIGQYIR